MARPGALRHVPRWFPRSDRRGRATLASAVVLSAVAGCATASTEAAAADRGTPGGTTAGSSLSAAAAALTPPTARRPLTAADLARVARTRVFFGHQSVGMNLLDAVPQVYAAQGVAAPPIGQGGTAAGPAGGFVVHAFIGENTKPLTKIAAFDRQLRGGTAGQVDVAVMKFCYIDFSPTTDVKALFTAYSTTMAGLERAYPKVTFVKATVPLMAEPGLRTRVTQKLTGNGARAAAENDARERFNALVRAEYSDDHLFDIAAVESTAPDGSREQGTYQGRTYYALHGGYTTDGGHLNEAGAQRVAAEWLRVLAAASNR